MIVKLLTEHHLEFLSLKGGCRGSSESTSLVKMSNFWKSHASAHIQNCLIAGIRYIHPVPKSTYKKLTKKYGLKQWSFVSY